MAALAFGAAAYAVPFKLNIAASGGNPTRIAAPDILKFLRNRRLLSAMPVSMIRPAEAGHYRLGRPTTEDAEDAEAKPCPSTLLTAPRALSRGEGDRIFPPVLRVLRVLRGGIVMFRTRSYGNPSRKCGARTSAMSSSLNLNPDSRNTANALRTVSRSADVSSRPNA